MGDRCSGNCCTKFNLPYGPDTLWRMYDQWVESKTPPLVNDIHIIAPMVKYLGYVSGADMIEGAGDGHYYTCKHHDTKTGNCGIYERRPAMCRDYPYGRSCHYTACTWDDGKAGLHPEHECANKTLEALSADDPRMTAFRRYGTEATKTLVEKKASEPIRYSPDAYLAHFDNPDHALEDDLVKTLKAAAE